MSPSKILSDLNGFHDGMLRAQKILDKFSVEFSTKLDSIGNDLDSLTSLTQDLRCNEDSPVASLLNKEIDSWTESLKQCCKSTKTNVTGRNFQNRFEKHPLVIVFGIVKAGKSTLGNFLHGRAFRVAPFDNVYKNEISKSEIIVEESGRQDVTRKEEFDENSIESTCSAQFFQIPGLAWVDTPGIGAIQKSSDLRPLGDIAKQYVRYADLVVFLSSSDHPEVIESVFGYQDLHREGKKLLIAITRSDMHKSTPDVALGKLIKTLVPKDKETRELQEKSLLSSLKRQGEEMKDLDAVSISTLLAENAVANQNDVDWEGSNIGAFYRKIIEVIGNEKILELKKEAPKKLLNSSIDAILGDKGKKDSLTALIGSMKTVLGNIQEKYNQLSPEGELVAMVTEDVVNQLRGAVRKYVEKNSKKEDGKTSDDTKKNLGSLYGFTGGKSSKKENAGVSISLEGIQDQVQQIVTSTLEGHIFKLLGEYHNVKYDIIDTTALQATATHKKDVHTYEARVAKSEKRDPSGFIENVKGFFGKKYYKVAWETEMRTIEIDLGIDTLSAKKELLQQLETHVTTFVRKQLESLRKQFFGQAQEKMEGLIEKLENIRQRLEKLRY